jgi:hypothetical protein
MHRTGSSHLRRSERNAPTGEPELDVLRAAHHAPATRTQRLLTASGNRVSLRERGLGSSRVGGRVGVAPAAQHGNAGVAGDAQ